MPERPPRICSLHKIQHLDGCPQCTATRWAVQDRFRGSSQARGYDGAWRRLATLALQRDMYLCQDCLDQGIHTTATEVDHVLPVDTHPHLRLNLDNCRSSCHPCHVRKTKRDKSNAPQA